MRWKLNHESEDILGGIGARFCVVKDYHGDGPWIKVTCCHGVRDHHDDGSWIIIIGVMASHGTQCHDTSLSKIDLGSVSYESACNALLTCQILTRLLLASQALDMSAFYSLQGVRLHEIHSGRGSEIAKNFRNC